MDFFNKIKGIILFYNKKIFVINLLLQIIFIYLFVATKLDIYLISYLMVFIIHILFLEKRLSEFNYSENERFFIIFIGFIFIFMPPILWLFEKYGNYNRREIKDRDEKDKSTENYIESYVESEIKKDDKDEIKKDIEVKQSFYELFNKEVTK